MGAPRPQAVRSPRRKRNSRGLSALVVIPLLGAAGLAVGWLIGHHHFSAAGPPVDGVYREAVVGDSILLEPGSPVLEPTDPDLTSLLYRGLVRVNEYGEVFPDLAARWSVSSDRRVYRFELREGLVWDDGQPASTADVLFSVRRAAEGAAALGEASIWRVTATHAVAPSVIEFVLPEPIAGFPEHAALPIVAAHAPPPGRLPLDPEEARPASNGPYRLAELSPDLIVLQRNPTYHGPPPRLARVEFHLMQSRDRAMEALLAGWVDGLGGLTVSERTLLASSNGVAIHQTTEYARYGLLVFNVHSPVFRELAVRRAASLGLDRALLIERVLFGDGEPALGPISPLSWAYRPVSGSQTYDPVAARELLDRAGWQAQGNGTRRRGARELDVSLLASDAEARRAEATEVARQLAAIGFRVAVQPVALDDLVQGRLRTGSFEAALVGRWLPELDPDQFGLWHSTQGWGLGGNYSGISDPRLDHWLEAGRRESDFRARAEAYEQFQLAWAQEVPGALLYHPYAFSAMRVDVLGVRDGPLPDATWRLRQLPDWYRQGQR